jgi:hypothetical protein
MQCGHAPITAKCFTEKEWPDMTLHTIFTTTVSLKKQMWMFHGPDHAPPFQTKWRVLQVMWQCFWNEEKMVGAACAMLSALPACPLHPCTNRDQLPRLVQRTSVPHWVSLAKFTQQRHLLQPVIMPLTTAVLSGNYQNQQWVFTKQKMGKHFMHHPLYYKVHWWQSCMLPGFKYMVY